MLTRAKNLFDRIYLFKKKLPSIEEAHLTTIDIRTQSDSDDETEDSKSDNEISSNDIIIEEVEIQNQQMDENKVSAWEVVNSLSYIVFSKENRLNLIGAGILTGINTALNYVAPYLLGQLATEKKDENNTQGYDTTTLVLALVVVGTINQLLPNLRSRLLASSAANSTRILMERSGEHHLTRSLDYSSQTEFGEKVQLVWKAFGVSRVPEPLLTQISPMLIETVMSASVLSYYYGPGMGLGFVGAAALLVGYTYQATPAIIHAREEQDKKGKIAGKKLTSLIKQYKNIHDFNKYAYEMNALRKAVNDIAIAEMKAQTMSLQTSRGQISIARLSMLGACIYVAKCLQSGTLEMKDFILLFTYLEKLSSIVPGVATALGDLFSTWPDLKFVLPALEKPSEITDPNPNVPLHLEAKTPPGIRFENVTFGYPKKPLLFRGLSFTVEPGKTVALVSESGGGKSTIFKLLYGYNKPISGTIFINNQDISVVSRSAVQESIGIVAQTPNLFHGSVGDNIRFGAKSPNEVSDQAIWDLAEQLHYTKFLKSALNRSYEVECIEIKPDALKNPSKIYIYLENGEPWISLILPRKTEDEKTQKNLHFKMSILGDSNLTQHFNHLLMRLKENKEPAIEKEELNHLLDLLLEKNYIKEKRLEHSVGEDGSALSGGEGQRIAILRSLFKPASIRVLDEVTSALDAITAENTMNGIMAITQHETKLMITHKLAEAIKYADKMVFIQNGRVLVEGTHDELLKKCIPYQELWEAQKAEAIKENANQHSTARIASMTNISIIAPIKTKTDPLYSAMSSSRKISSNESLPISNKNDSKNDNQPAHVIKNVK